MRVKCVICDKIEAIEDESLLAKRLRNRPIHTYMCKICDARIAINTQKRIESGNFNLFQSKVKEEEW